MKTYFTIAVLICVCSISAIPMLHRFDFNGSFADDFGGPDLIPVHTVTNGFLDGNWNWTADTTPGGGLLLQTSLPNPEEYSLRLVFKYDNFYSSWTKIISFTGYNSASNYFSSDNGLYFYQNRLQFYPYISNPDVPFFPNTWYDLIFTRNTDGLIRIFLTLLGQPQQMVLQFTDPGVQAVPGTYGDYNCWGLFYDDYATSSEWTSGGSVGLIEVWGQSQVFDAVLNPHISNTGGQINLSWDPYPNALSYNIYAAPDPTNGPWELLGNTLGSDMSFTATFPFRFFRINAVLN